MTIDCPYCTERAVNPRFNCPRCGHPLAGPVVPYAPPTGGRLTRDCADDRDRRDGRERSALRSYDRYR